jgi:membrane protein
MVTMKAWALVKETFNEFLEDNVFRLSAALAYYALFSIGPLILLTMGSFGLVFGEERVSSQLKDQMVAYLGPEVSEGIQQMLVTQNKKSSLTATIIGIVGLLIGATGVFGQLQDALNTIWEVKTKPGLGIMGFIRTRFLSLAMVFGIGFLLLVSLLLETFIAAFSDYIGFIMEIPKSTIYLANTGISFATVTVLFAMIFKFLPDVEVRWKDVWIGALGTAVLFALGKFLLGFYLGRESTSSAYGAAGSIVIVLLYFYYSSFILILGAEFTQVYARMMGTRIQPSAHAIRITEADRDQQGIPHRKHVDECMEEDRRNRASGDAASAPPVVAGALGLRQQIPEPGNEPGANAPATSSAVIIASFLAGAAIAISVTRRLAVRIPAFSARAGVRAKPAGFARKKKQPEVRAAS